MCSWVITTASSERGSTSTSDNLRDSSFSERPPSMSIVVDPERTRTAFPSDPLASTQTSMTSSWSTRSYYPNYIPVP